MRVQLPLAPEFIDAHQAKLHPLVERFQKNGSLHTTLLFTGIEGVGKKSLVLHFLQTIFCDESIFSGANAEEEEAGLFGATPVAAVKTGTEPCGRCKSCLRASKNQWADLFWFDPEMPEEGHRLGLHKIDAFRELRTKLGMGPSEEPFRVAVIADADLMQDKAANSILKMLEEPPKNWIFILTASDSSRLLPTILSRCMEVKLAPIPPETLVSILKTVKGADFNSTRAEVASKAAQGSIARAFQYLNDDVWELRARILGLLTNPAQEWMKLVERLAESQQTMHLGLDLMESIFSDLLLHQIEGIQHPWVHSDQRPLLLQIAESKHLTPAKLTRLLDALSEKRKWVNLTLNAKLLAQEILNPVLEVL